METQLNLFGNLLNGASFSDDKSYRYVLWRIWDNNKKMAMFIGLNPSTADELRDDPTIRRVKTFARDWGYGGIYMLNLFTYVTAYPEELQKCENSVLMADEHLIDYAGKSDLIIFCWGSFPLAIERAKVVTQMFPQGKVLLMNKNGTPRHPLYIPGDTQPIKYLTYGPFKNK